MTGTGIREERNRHGVKRPPIGLIGAIPRLVSVLPHPPHIRDVVIFVGK